MKVDRESHRKALETLGFVFGYETETEACVVMVETTLPEGWTWNESDPSEPCLIDPKGNQRSTCTWLHGEFVHMLYRRFFQQSNGARTKG
ncbi:MAG: hypothetical protein ABIH21_01100, partial [Patescibacteria group bacterium]